MNSIASSRVLPLFLAISCLLAPASSIAEKTSEASERWYEVELIIFADPRQTYEDAEVWPVPLPELKMERAVDLLPAAVPPPDEPAEAVRFQALSSDQLQLNEAFQRLTESSRFEPLLHVGWRQPALPRETAIPIHLQTTWMEATELAAGLESQADSGDMPRFTDLGARKQTWVEGTVALKLGRYLHLEADLRYTLPGIDTADPERFLIGRTGNTELDSLDTPGDSDVPHDEVYRLSESRRVRSGELHYFDHPLFGMIALVTPYELPEPVDPDPVPVATDPPVRGGTIQRR